MELFIESGSCQCQSIGKDCDLECKEVLIPTQSQGSPVKKNEYEIDDCYMNQKYFGH